MKKKLFFVIIIGVLVVSGLILLDKSKKTREISDASINSFESCVAIGYPILETYPEQCKTPDGRTFVRELSNEEVSPADRCVLSEGNWLEEFNECEYIGEDWCVENGGVFSDCESACRHDTEAENCTLQCVPVCHFGN